MYLYHSVTYGTMKIQVDKHMAKEDSIGLCFDNVI